MSAWDAIRSGVFLVVLALTQVVGAQSGTNVSASVEAAGRVELLESLHASLIAKEEEVARLETQLKEATNETTRKASSENLQSSAAEFLELKRKFQEAVSGVDLGLFVEQAEEAFSWEENLGDIVKPIVAEIKNATAESRKIAELRKTKAEYSERADAASEAIGRIESILAAEVPAELRQTLQEQLTVWQRRESVAKNQVGAADLQLQQILAAQRSLMESSKDFFRGFMSSRGMSLLFGVFAFLVVFFGVRLAFLAWQKRRQTRGSLTLNDRILNLSVRVGAVLFGMLASIIVFNLRSDWFLLSIVLVLFLGLSWVSIKALPRYVEAVSFVLNLGPVREGEILEFQGVLWRVESIGFKTYLRNERLEGGWLRVPYKSLLDRISRARGESELLFPTEKGDWILLNDALTEVVVQTPNQVMVRHEGGAEVSLPVADFVAAHPVNLSRGYRLETVFGIDYAHQSLATSEIPGAMSAALRKGLDEIAPTGGVKAVSVNFASAGASSLDFEIEVDLDGSVAKDRQRLSFAIQRILVDLCTERNWEIPFPQLAVTRKGSES